MYVSPLVYYTASSGCNREDGMYVSPLVYYTASSGCNTERMACTYHHSFTTQHLVVVTQRGCHVRITTRLLHSI